MLKGGQGVCESETHYAPLKGSVAHAEGGFPSITYLYADQMVGMSEIKFGKNLDLVLTVEEVRGVG